MPLEILSSMYDGLCSSVGTTPKLLLADDTKLPPDSLFSRLTVKVRDLGTNTYIGIGVTSQNFRLTGINQALTLEAPVINGTVVPLLIKTTVLGNGSSGVLEITGIRVYEGGL